MCIRFRKITEFEPGIISDLLSRSYAGILNQELESKFKRFDDEAFANPETIGACTFITEWNDNCVGLASFDPRQKPIGIIGHNCILQEFRGKGLGKKQIQEVLRRLTNMGFQKAIVKTGDHPFFESAKKMYLNCGFKEVGRYINSNDRFAGIEYEIELLTL
jgi:GNAT superfamily N-acetyltransferase